MGRVVAKTRWHAHKNRVRKRHEEDEEDAFKPVRSQKRLRAHEDWECEGVKISDHAVLRFLEHCCGLDVAKVRAAMVSDGRAEMIRGMRSGKVPAQSGARLVVRDGLVVTVIASHNNSE